MEIPLASKNCGQNSASRPLLSCRPSASFRALDNMIAQTETTHPYRRRRRKHAEWRREVNTRSATIGMISLAAVFVLLLGFILFSALHRGERFPGVNTSFPSQLFDPPGAR
jgi:hypothetical protein